jgi:CBS domain-containing protein
MKAVDLMTRPATCVRPEATVRSVATIISEQKLGAVPVTDDDGRLLGIVSEADLVRRAEIGTDALRLSWFDLWAGLAGPAATFVKAHAANAGDVMTRSVVTATEETPLDEVAALLDRHRVRQLPVMRDGTVVGLISRADLVRAVAGAEAACAAADEQDSDRAIRARVIERIHAQPFGMPWLVTVQVDQGVVTLWGTVSSEAERHAVRVAAASAPGVGSIKDYLFSWPA